jgi:hypothetical protein
MFFLGVVFAALWWASVHFGRKVDEAKARFAAQAEASGAPEPPGAAESPGAPGVSGADAG